MTLGSSSILFLNSPPAQGNNTTKIYISHWSWGDIQFKMNHPSAKKLSECGCTCLPPLPPPKKKHWVIFTKLCCFWNRKLPSPVKLHRLNYIAWLRVYTKLWIKDWNNWEQRCMKSIISLVGIRRDKCLKCISIQLTICINEYSTIGQHVLMLFVNNKESQHL